MEFNYKHRHDHSPTGFTEKEDSHPSICMAESTVKNHTSHSIGWTLGLRPTAQLVRRNYPHKEGKRLTMLRSSSLSLGWHLYFEMESSSITTSAASPWKLKAIPSSDGLILYLSSLWYHVVMQIQCWPKTLFDLK